VLIIDSFVALAAITEVLPLVEFSIEESVDSEEALQLIKTQPPEEQIIGDKEQERDFELYEHQPQSQSSRDPFSAYLDSEQIRDKNVTIVLDRDALTRLKPTEVIVCRWPEPLPSRYYRNFMPEVVLKHCKHCNKVSYQHIPIYYYHYSSSSYSY